MIQVSYFKNVSPEAAGVKSARVRAFVEGLEQARLSRHNIILARGDRIFYENYRAPFGPDVLHRMYSVSKSFVSLAVGFAVQDGLLSLDDTMEKHFERELEGQNDKYMRAQTVRNMLMMSTAKPAPNWFASRGADRVAYYFANKAVPSRPGGTIFQYDSSGSFVLGALVERLCGMPFMEYLRLKLFDKIGVSKEARCLVCPGGHSWGDSAVLATARDLLAVARFTMNGGSWQGEQLLDAGYVKDATSKLIDNSPYSTNEYNAQGYGYLIWKCWGKGCQFAICAPEKDLILIYNGDNQGLDFAPALIFNSFYKYIVDTAGDPMPESVESDWLCAWSDRLTLMSAHGEPSSPLAGKINGRHFILESNHMGITEFTLNFNGSEGSFNYKNAQGEKSLPFGMRKNIFGLFPEEGYSREVGGVGCPGHRYKCAASAAWLSPERLYLDVQIIDDYLGRLGITFGFIQDSEDGTDGVDRTDCTNCANHASRADGVNLADCANHASHADGANLADCANHASRTDCANLADCTENANRVEPADQPQSSGIKVGLQMVKTAEDFLNEYSGFAAGYSQSED